jgi:nitroreductase
MISELVKKCRSYRRFYQAEHVSATDLLEMVDNARLSASARNCQSLKYIISNDNFTNAIIFPCLSWAGYLKDWPGPEEGEQPSAYIVILNDKDITQNYFCDDGIASQTILLTAVENGLGGCIIGSVNHSKLREGLAITDRFDIVHVIALGKPKEEVILEVIGNDGDIKYWRDEQQVHHVPKRSLEQVVLKKPLKD